MKVNRHPQQPTALRLSAHTAALLTPVVDGMCKLLGLYSSKTTCGHICKLCRPADKHECVYGYFSLSQECQKLWHNSEYILHRKCPAILVCHFLISLTSILCISLVRVYALAVFGTYLAHLQHLRDSAPSLCRCAHLAQETLWPVQQLTALAVAHSE